MPGEVKYKALLRQLIREASLSEVIAEIRNESEGCRTYRYAACYVTDNEETANKMRILKDAYPIAKSNKTVRFVKDKIYKKAVNVFTDEARAPFCDKVDILFRCRIFFTDKTAVDLLLEKLGIKDKLSFSAESIPTIKFTKNDTKSTAPKPRSIPQSVESGSTIKRFGLFGENMTSKIKRVKTRNEPVPSVQDRNTFRNKPITDTSITSDVPPATSETVIRNIEVSTNLTRIGNKTDETPTAESIKKRMSFARLLNNSNSAEVDKEEATSPTWSM